MNSSHVVYSGWLRKSPPEKKLVCCAWRKCWFVLRSSQESSDPGFLEYYKNARSKKPLRIISLRHCEQVDAGVSFDRKDLPKSFVFNVKTRERTFYLVAQSKEDMCLWVWNICHVCGFRRAVENTGTTGSSSPS